MEVVILTVCAAEVRRFLNTLPQPIAVAVGAGRRSLETDSACATRDKIAIDDPVPLPEGLAETIPLHVLSQAVNLSHHLVAEDAGEPRSQTRAVSAPHVQVRAADVSAANFHQNVLWFHFR
jgi:predicted acyltransferase